MQKLTDREKELILTYQNLIWKVIHDIEKKFNIQSIGEKELFQQGMMILMENIRTWKPKKGKFISWFYQIIRTNLIRYIISEQKMVATDCKNDVFEGSIEVTANIGELIEEKKQKLTDREREYFERFYENDKDIKDISKEFNVSLQAVGKIIRKINEKIK